VVSSEMASEGAGEVGCSSLSVSSSTGDSDSSVSNESSNCAEAPVARRSVKSPAANPACRAFEVCFRGDFMTIFLGTVREAGKAKRRRLAHSLDGERGLQLVRIGRIVARGDEQRVLDVYERPAGITPVAQVAHGDGDEDVLRLSRLEETSSLKGFDLLGG